MNESSVGFEGYMNGKFPLDFIAPSESASEDRKNVLSCLLIVCLVPEQ